MQRRLGSFSTMLFGIILSTVAALAQHAGAQPGTISGETLTFTYPQRPRGVNYPEHDLFAAGVHVHNAQYVMFTAKGKNDAHVLLKRDRHDYKSHVVEVVLGGWRNKKSVIRNKQQGPALATSKGKVLSKSRYNTFWISWTGGCVKVGKGGRVGDREMMKWCGLTHAINYMSASFGYGSGGNFQFLKTATQMTYYCDYSPGSVDYPKHDLTYDGVDGLLSSSIVFTTKGRNDAHVLLKRDDKNYDRNVVEIVLGGWGDKKSVIRDRQQGPSKATHTENDIVTPTEDRYFWISWADRCVKVGKGYSVGKQEMMKWCGLNHEVNYVSASYGFGSDGYFTFIRTAGAP